MCGEIAVHLPSQTRVCVRPHATLTTACRAARAEAGTLEAPRAIPQQRPTGLPQAALGMLGGADLHAAILQKRTQLRPVAEAVPAPTGLQPSTSTTGMAANGSAAKRVGIPVPSASADGGSLEAVLRRGLERFHFDDAVDPTAGNTDFIRAASKEQ